MQNDILFDVDLTLFNTTFFAQTRDQLLGELYKIPLQLVEQYRFEYIKSLSSQREFNPKDLCKFICKSESYDPIDMYENIFQVKSIYRESLFDDTLPTLKLLRSNNYNLGLFTEGVSFFQLNKVKFSNILKYFKKSLIFNFPNKRTDDVLEMLPRDCLIVDDKQDILELVKKQRPDIRCILLKRDSIESQKDVINSLTQLTLLIYTAPLKLIS
jgi:hypothetical protein